MTESKRKVADEHRVFQQKWGEEFAFVEVKDKPVCLICQRAIAVMKRDNLKRHHDTHNQNGEKFSEEYPPGSIMKKEKIRLLKMGLHGQQSTLIPLNKYKRDTEDYLRSSTASGF